MEEGAPGASRDPRGKVQGKVGTEQEAGSQRSGRRNSRTMIQSHMWTQTKDTKSGTGCGQAVLLTRERPWAVAPRAMGTPKPQKARELLTAISKGQDGLTPREGEGGKVGGLCGLARSSAPQQEAPGGCPASRASGDGCVGGGCHRLARPTPCSHTRVRGLVPCPLFCFCGTYVAWERTVIR